MNRYCSVIELSKSPFGYEVGTGKRLAVLRAQTASADVDRAIAEIAEGLSSGSASEPSVTLLFCSPKYDLAQLGRKVAKAFPGPIISCTTAGQLGQNGYQQGGITAVSLTSPELVVTPYLISPLAECQARASEVAFSAMSGLLGRGSASAFGLVLVDGLARAEERLAASLSQSLSGVPLIGGSAGDELAFQETHVYYEGRFLRDAAVFALFETTLPFATFKVQHVVPGRRKLVVTGADPEQRVVFEFNGEPAAEVYAETLGVEVDELDSLVFSRSPLMLRSGDDYYIRSVKSRGADHSLTFFCGLEEGLVLTVGEASDPLVALQRGFDDARLKVEEPAVVLACDCVLRRLEFEHSGIAGSVGEFMAKNGAVGFSTYGEQFNAIHVNQTLTAVAIGG